MANANNDTAVLAGDIGGTKTNLGLFIKGRRRPLLKAIETYSSQEAPNLEHIIDKSWIEILKNSSVYSCYSNLSTVCRDNYSENITSTI